ncbi:PDZ domain-containing protein [Erysipelothrix sp. HDW6C]|uniref:S41 family peptidase n=1 Tax=Erysipelothrix sp. HDW6C TaxID=2714930 RepID=UPI0014077118|nr:S41 family peptidase [Erysipelothrix sp. HDW6C]QIK68879.1 PDZ domain-containing protein [Erysipelothrix sp. HDW6C]
MDKENGKVQVKLERHVWPDEIASRKKKNKLAAAIVVAVVISFLGGIGVSSLFKDNSIVGNGSKNQGIFERVFNDIRNKWYFTNEMEDPDTELTNNAIKGMLEANGDRHTSFMTPEEMLGLEESINMSFVGIGVQFYEGENVNIITDVFKNSPAEKAGVQAGDIINKVDGVLLSEGDTPVKDRIIGEEGTEVTIEVLRDQKPISITMVRGTVNALASGHMLDDGVAYLEIKSFGRQLGEVTESYFKDFKAQNADKLIIDLRNNGGGYLDAIQSIARLFLQNGDVVYQEKFTDGTIEVYTVSKSVADEYKFDKIVILVNENSASASEVLTLALRDNLGAETVGVKSYGKGTVQTQITYGDKGALKITIAEWLGPTGESINGTGIVPMTESKLPAIFYQTYVKLEEGESIGPDSVHASVAYVQDGLTYLGFHSGRTDGYYDQATLNAFNQYAAIVGLPGDGQITETVMKQIYSSVYADWALNRDARDVQLHKAIEVIKK